MELLLRIHLSTRIGRRFLFFVSGLTIVLGASFQAHAKPSCELIFNEAPLRFVAQSSAMLEAVGAAKKFAPYDISVYLEGRTGSGKEVLAGYIHEQSHRPGELVTVNLGALPEDLIASELFGHKRGSFTGAVQDRKGLVAQAEKGTLFLDEIADLSPKSQLLLLRFIESKTYHVVGESKESQADVRFIFATHKDLESLVRQGVFREDLFNRIAVVRIDLPSLSERPEDVLPLARHFLKEKAKEFGRPVPELSDQAIAFLQAHSFSGNVRELSAMMSRAVIVTPVGQAIEPKAFLYGRRSRDASNLEFPAISEVPKAELPKIEIPQAEVPKFEAPKIEAPKVEKPVISQRLDQMPTFKTDDLRRIAFIQAYSLALAQDPRGKPSMVAVSQHMGLLRRNAADISLHPTAKAWVKELHSNSERERYSLELQRALAVQLPTLNPRKLINYSILYALNRPDAELLDRRGHVTRISQSAWAESLGIRRTALLVKLRDTNGWNINELIAEREQNGSVDVEKWMQKLPKDNAVDPQ